MFCLAFVPRNFGIVSFVKAIREGSASGRLYFAHDIIPKLGRMWNRNEMAIEHTGIRIHDYCINHHTRATMIQAYSSSD